MIIKLGLPKGSLQESTLRMFKRAGFEISVTERSYFPLIDDDRIEPILLRAQEMPRYVQEGTLDCGITGKDWILENSSDVVEVTDLAYAKKGLGPVRWVLAVPAESPLHKIEDLGGKRIATELVNVTKDFLKRKRVNAQVEFSWGATEAKVATKLVDAVVELTETGRSLRENNLREISVVCQSTTLLIANRKSWRSPQKRKGIENLALLLKGAILAIDMVGLKMNVSKANLNKVLSILPAMRKPTVSGLSQRGWFAVETVTDQKKVRDLIPKLKRAGAEGIIEYSLNKVIY